MLVLGIETSCDETGLAFVEKDKVLHAVLSSQVDLHALFGGVVPELASRQHNKFLPILFDSLLEESGYTLENIQGIAVANGPGLLGSLLVGLSFAKALALGLKLPLIGVNHLHAHLAAASIENKVEYPALGVLVSGGHTHLYYIENPTTFYILGRTLDDAAGEACDKFGKMIGLPYPGGALLDLLGQRGTVHAKLFPRPYTKNNSLDFSFSGLKTAASMFLEENPAAAFPPLSTSEILSQSEQKARISSAPQILADAAASYLFAIADTLCIKAELALNMPEYKNIKSLVLAGGVAANSFVRANLSKLAIKHHLQFAVPSFGLCTDNAQMIAYLGALSLEKGIQHSLNLHAFPRGTKE